eukprot:scaffold129252_cov16-Tisochrysis_lutea.AAC.2
MPSRYGVAILKVLTLLWLLITTLLCTYHLSQTSLVDKSDGQSTYRGSILTGFTNLEQETWLPMPFAVAAHKTCSPVAAAMLMMLTRSESRPSPVTPASRSHHETSSEPICPLKARHVANSSLEGSLIPEGPGSLQGGGGGEIPTHRGA